MREMVIAGLMPTPDMQKTVDWQDVPADALEEAMRWARGLQSLPDLAGNLTDAKRILADRMSVSFGTVNRMLGWARNGKTLESGRVVLGFWALIDYRTHRAAAPSGIPDATVQWWLQMVEQFKGRANCLRQAHKRCLAYYRMPEFNVPGYSCKPAASKHGIPEGWGYSNFVRLVNRSEMVKVLARTGAKAASSYAFHIPTTRVGLSVMECVMVDDQWTDFKVKQTLRSAPGRMFELAVLDLFSANKVIWGNKCETTDDVTGIRKRIQERDMRFLLAALFSIHGYRKGGTTLICESGTAVVRDDIAQALFEQTGGAIKVETGKCRDTPAFPGWYRGKGGGNPRFKAALESHFNLERNAAAMFIGQTGSNERVNGPEELIGRGKHDEMLLKALTGLNLPREKLEMLKWDFMLMSQAQSIMADIYHWLNDRHDHDLEGWEAAGLVTGQVRMGPQSPNWIPTYALPTKTPEQAEALRALTRLPGCFELRKMSPAEVFARESGDLVKIPMSLLPAIIGKDLAVERSVNDHGSFLFQDAAISHEPLRFVGLAVNPQGQEVLLRNGESYLTFCNPFDQRYLLVCDAKGRYVGRCERVNKVCRADAEGLHRAMGIQAHVNSARAREFLARNAGHAEERAENEAWNAEILSGAPVLPHEIDVQDEIDDTRVTASDREAAVAHGGGTAGERGNDGEFSAAEIADFLKT